MLNYPNTPSHLVDYSNLYSHIEKKSIDEINEDIRSKNIILDESINMLKELANKRVDSDRKILKDKTNDIIKLTSLMSRYFDKTLSESENSGEDILKIKDELITLNMSEASQRELKVVQTKLVATIHKIENSIKTNCKIINDHKIQFNSLCEQLRKLQEELSIAREEKENLEKTFNLYEFIHFSVITIIFYVTFVMIIPFVTVYTKGIKDVNYI